jgi:phosphoribosylamine--glycine ligase
VITGLDEAAESALVFHAGTRREGDRILVDGGRVLAVTSTGADLAAARTRAYRAVSRIEFEGAHYRTDIGARKR